MYQTIIAEKLEDLRTSVADPGRILIFIHPGSRIQKQQQRRMEKYVLAYGTYLYYVATNMKNLSQFTKIIVPFFWQKKIVIKLS